MARSVNTYSGIHRRLSITRGRARDHTCPCGKPALEWAYKGGDPDELISDEGFPYSVDPDFYQAMCRSCHRRHDRPQCPQGHDFTPENTIIDGGKRKCKTCVYDRNRRYSRANRSSRRRSASPMY